MHAGITQSQERLKFDSNVLIKIRRLEHSVSVSARAPMHVRLVLSCGRSILKANLSRMIHIEAPIEQESQQPGAQLVLQPVRVPVSKQPCFIQTLLLPLIDLELTPLRVEQLQVLAPWEVAKHILHRFEQPKVRVDPLPRLLPYGHA